MGAVKQLAHAEGEAPIEIPAILLVTDPILWSGAAMGVAVAPLANPSACE